GLGDRGQGGEARQDDERERHQANHGLHDLPPLGLRGDFPSPNESAGAPVLRAWPPRGAVSGEVATPTSRLAELHPAWLQAVCVTRCEFFAWTRSFWNLRERGRSGTG